ncbi:MAG: hydrogenase maturation nickel metallochaperone HypA [Bacillota bacterium]|jgi:hydrogenase nickel incorporation protein HypA/HybF
MHEYSITQQIIKIAEEAARENKAKKITKISLVVGELSGFIGDSITMYFEIIARGTLAEAAQLEIKHVKTQFWCENCQEHYLRARFSFDCPKCGQQGVPTEIGKEFYIDGIEIATD